MSGSTECLYEALRLTKYTGLVLYANLKNDTNKILGFDINALEVTFIPKWGSMLHAFYPAPHPSSSSHEVGSGGSNGHNLVDTGACQPMRDPMNESAQMAQQAQSAPVEKSQRPSFFRQLSLNSEGD